MERLVRTKIKGNSVDSSNDGRVPKFDDLPALPTCYKEPVAVLEEMRRAILKMDRSPSTIAITRRHDVTSPRSESEGPFMHSMDFNPEGPFALSPYLLPTSNDAHNVPSMRFHVPIQAYNDKSGSIMYTNQSSFEGMSHQVHTHTQMLPVRANGHANDACFNPLSHSYKDFEPLPFWDDNDSYLGGDLANFIEGVLQCVED